MLGVRKRALARGVELGVDGAAIADMAYRGAAYTHPRGNTRFDDYWFCVLDDEVWEMGLINPSMVSSWVIFPEAEACTYCDGAMRVIMVDAEDNSERLVPCRRMNDRSLPLCSD